MFFQSVLPAGKSCEKCLKSWNKGVHVSGSHESVNESDQFIFENKTTCGEKVMTLKT